MKLMFLTNVLSPHTKFLSNSFYEKLGDDFLVVETLNCDRSQLPIGWRLDEKALYTVSFTEFCQSNEKYQRLIDECDVVIFGSAPLKLIKNRLKANRLTFRFSERVYKKKCPWYELPLRAVKYYFQYGRYKNLYLLCASAYTAGDYAKTGTFKNRSYKFGYFPQLIEYEDIAALMSSKQKNSLLWAGRIIDWKHPEFAVEVAKKLKENGYDFTLNIIGTGEMEEEIKALIDKYDLTENVKMLGQMPPEDVRKYMEKSQIFLFTSDRGEGWGAVLNEAMNSGCVCVADRDIGSVPFLIENNTNGSIYKNSSCEEIFEKVKYLIDDPEKCSRMGEAAYFTIKNNWNANEAANRFFVLSEKILEGEKSPNVFSDDVCSRAENLN